MCKSYQRVDGDHAIEEMLRPVDSHSGARENIIAGPYHFPRFYMSWDRFDEGVEREETWGEVSLHHLTRGTGERRKLPQRGRAENGFYAYFRSERSHLEHHFQYFWATAGPPKHRGARENFPPHRPPTLSTGLEMLTVHQPGVSSNVGVNTPYGVCLSVGLVCRQGIRSSNVFEWIFMQFSGGVGRGRRKNRLEFGGSPNSFVDAGSFSRILQHYETEHSLPRSVHGATRRSCMM